MRILITYVLVRGGGLLGPNNPIVDSIKSAYNTWIHVYLQQLSVWKTDLFGKPLRQFRTRLQKGFPVKKSVAGNPAFILVWRVSVCAVL